MSTSHASLQGQIAGAPLKNRKKDIALNEAIADESSATVRDRAAREIDDS